MNNEEQYPKNRSKFAIFSVKHWRFAKRKERTIQVEYPDGWSNCGITTDNHFIADTNNGAKWDTLKFPLPKPKYKWNIKGYGGFIGTKNSKQFVTLIDKK